MSIAVITDLTKSYGAELIFSGVSFRIEARDRLGLVGPNGAGKTTLLNLLAGRLTPDTGSVVYAQGTSIGYLPQIAEFAPANTLHEEMLAALEHVQGWEREMGELAARMGDPTTLANPDEYAAVMERYADVQARFEHAGGYTIEQRARQVLDGLGFTREQQAAPATQLSGGQQTRAALGRLLLQEPDLLLLDEPTNHLDLAALEWLEEYLGKWDGSVVVVSHDRYFLDRVTTRTVEVARSRLAEYIGGYSKYLVQRAERFEAELAAYEKQRNEIEHVEAFISRFRAQASKAGLVQSRVKQLEKTVRLEPPAGLDKPPAIRFPACERGARRVFELTGAVKKYGELTIYDGIDLVIERGARIALVGPNGAGKSTMMKLLAGVEPLSAGQRQVGEGVRLGYFAQNLAEGLDYDKRVLNELSDAAEGMTSSEIRSLLGAMLFSGDEVEKRVGVLSGGERARIALAKVLAHRNNCLLLDEPTNNLDIIAKDTLLEALRRFPGTVVIVSHDRYLLNELVTEVIEVGQGDALRYLGNYDEYLAKKAAMAAASEAAAPAPAARNGGGAPERNGRIETERRDQNAARKREREAERRREQAARARQRIEGAIEQKETEKTDLGRIMNDPNFYLTRGDANDVMVRYETLGREIDALYAELLNLDRSPEAPG